MGKNLLAEGMIFFLEPLLAFFFSFWHSLLALLALGKDLLAEGMIFWLREGFFGSECLSVCLSVCMDCRKGFKSNLAQIHVSIRLYTCRYLSVYMCPLSICTYLYLSRQSHMYTYRNLYMYIPISILRFEAKHFKNRNNVQIYSR